MQFISMINKFFQVLGQIFGWFFGLAKKSTKMPPQVYVILHLTIIALTTLLLAFFSTSIIKKANVPISDAPFVQNYYCGIVFFTFYVFARIVLYIIALFQIEEESDFPDIDRAWDEGLEALGEAGLDVRWLPIFLVTGVAQPEEADFFSAAKFKWKVTAPSASSRAPLRFYATEEAVFISCAGVCAASLRGDEDDASELSAPSHMGSDGDGVGEGTLQRGAIQAAGDQTISAPSFAQTLQPGAHAAMVASIGASSDTASKPISLDPEDLDLARERLGYFCRLLTRTRAPYCPANGVLLAAPLGRATAQPLLQDVRTMREQLRLAFPIVYLFSGLDKFNGFEELLDRGCRIDRRFRDTRAGSRFPMGHVVDEEAAQWGIGRGLDWFQGWIYSEFSKDIANPENKKLYLLLCKLDEQRHRLELLMRQSLECGRDEEVTRLSGCYFGAYGPGVNQKAFVHGALQKLVSEQDEIAWSHTQLERDARSRSMAYIVMALSGVLVAANGFFIWKLM